MFLNLLFEHHSFLMKKGSLILSCQENMWPLPDHLLLQNYSMRLIRISRDILTHSGLSFKANFMNLLWMFANLIRGYLDYGYCKGGVTTVLCTCYEWRGVFRLVLCCYKKIMNPLSQESNLCFLKIMSFKKKSYLGSVCASIKHWNNDSWNKNPTREKVQ